MSTRSVLTACAAIVLVLVFTFGTSADEKTILIELEQRSESLPTGVSASGTVVSGGFNNGAGGLYWMPTTGVIFAGGVTATGVSRDGHTIVGWARDARGVQQAAIWVRATEWRLLGSFAGSAGPCDASLSQATGVNRDGQTVVGFAWNGCAGAHAFRWQESTGMVDLGSTVQGRSSRGLGVSADGMVVVGDQTTAEGFNQGARWAGGRQELMTGPGGPAGSATAANHDGSMVVGRVCVPAGGRFDENQSAWIWKAQGGLTCLPPPRRLVSPGPPIIIEAAATSDDGQVIGGSQSVGGSADSNAILWIGGQPTYLKDFLQANGLPNAFRTWINTGTITGMSPDGRVLVGWGAAVGGFRGYMVILGSGRVMPS
jgi:probable HAF family extracellular repeat protein